MAKARTAVATKKQAQAPKAPAPKAEAKVKREALGILKTTDKATLETIIKALNGTFAVSDVKTGGSFFRVRLYSK